MHHLTEAQWIAIAAHRLQQDRKLHGTDWDLIAEDLYEAVRGRLPPQFVAQTYMNVGGFDWVSDHQ